MSKDYNKINEDTYNKISVNWETKRQFFWKPVVTCNLIEK